MAVASPYAVFRAADLAWPVSPRLAAPLSPEPAASRAAAHPKAGSPVRLIQGDLFQPLPVG